jgi:hypothetical protein
VNSTRVPEKYVQFKFQRIQKIQNKIFSTAHNGHPVPVSGTNLLMAEQPFTFIYRMKTLDRTSTKILLSVVKGILQNWVTEL